MEPAGYMPIVTHAMHVCHTSNGLMHKLTRHRYLVVVPESQRKLVSVVGVKLLEDHLRGEGLEQSLVNVQ